jgi:hypothetical protein
LRKRIEQLEQQLSAAGQGTVTQPSLDRYAAKPVAAVESEAATTALEQALIDKGLVLLAPGQFRVTPSASWGHSGSSGNTLDTYAFAMRGEAGLPWGMAAGVFAPYVYAHQDTYGSNDGWGDVTFSLSKTLTAETESVPSLVARLDYTHDTGRAPFAWAAIGSGFEAFTATISALKRYEPVAIYGNLSYQHSLSRTVTIDQGPLAGFQGKVSPGDGYGARMGLSLAATPEIALDSTLTFNFYNPTRFQPTNGPSYEGARSTVGYISLIAGFLLAKNLFLSVTAAAGVTKDASDFVFSVALPYTF